MSRRRLLSIVVTATLASSPWPAQAQAKDQFVQGLVSFLTAVDGPRGDEGPAVAAAIEAMAEGLAQWDGFVARVEAGLASEIESAPPPTAARMRAALGTAYLDRGRLDAALAQFDLAATLDPAFADVHALRGLAFELANRPQDAAAAYRQAWQRDQSNAAHAYRFLRSSTKTDVSDSAAALKTLRAAVEGARPGANPPVFLAIALLDDASVTVPEFALATYSDAFALVRQAKYDEAVARLRSAAARDPLLSDPALATPEVAQAIAVLKRNADDQALAGLVAAARRHPDSSEVHRILGVAYAVASKHDASVAELRTAVRLSADNERARLALADVLVASKDDAAARVVLSETNQVIPSSGQGLWKLGKVHQSFGDEANAVRAFEAAARLSPFAGASLLQAAIGRLYYNQLDLDAAASAYLRRISLTPHDSAAHRDLGEVYRAQDNQDAALAEALVAALLDPTDARSFAMIGQIHAASNRDEDAVAALRKAVALDPSHLEAHYALSRALARLNRVDEARAELQIFEQLQAKAMAEQRQQFQQNLQKIEDTLKAADPRDRAR